MSDDLKPCPACRKPPVVDMNGDRRWCNNERCPAQFNVFTEELWNALARRDDKIPFRDEWPRDRQAMRFQAACAAMPALMSNAGYRIDDGTPEGGDLDFEAVAYDAVEQADALLAELEKPR